jgi:hypothetical protein
MGREGNFRYLNSSNTKYLQRKRNVSLKQLAQSHFLTVKLSIKDLQIEGATLIFSISCIYLQMEKCIMPTTTPKLPSGLIQGKLCT